MPRIPPADDRESDFPGRRWLIVGLRALHLLAIVAAAVVLHGAPPPGGLPFPAIAGTLFASGLAMLALDVAAHRDHLRTIAGLTVLAKLGAVVWLAVQPAPALFWALVALSSVVSHAPASFRRRRIF